MTKSAQLLIHADSRSMGRCRSCGATVEWAALTTGKRMPFDPPIRPVATQEDLFSYGRVVEVVETATSVPHFATCPDAEKWRKR